jgi:hypothetical protein
MQQEGMACRKAGKPGRKAGNKCYQKTYRNIVTVELKNFLRTLIRRIIAYRQAGKLAKMAGFLFEEICWQAGWYAH